MEYRNFEEYLKGKKIDPDLFMKEDPGLFEEYRNLYDLIHPESFTSQKLFKINGIRRKYQLKSENIKTTPSATPAAKPKISMKPKIK